MMKGNAAFKNHHQILVMKYRAAKNKVQNKPKVVHLLTTKHRATMQNTTRRDADGNLVQKREAILYYNRKMGDVDVMDKQLQTIQIAQSNFL